jgi:hypothetical protein
VISATTEWQPPRAAHASVVIILAAAIGTILIPERTEITPERTGFASFLMQLEEWRGTTGRIEHKYLSVLKLDDYLLADFQLPGDRGNINLYVAYYGSQRKGA